MSSGRILLACDRDQSHVQVLTVVGDRGTLRRLAQKWYEFVAEVERGRDCCHLFFRRVMERDPDELLVVSVLAGRLPILQPL